MPGHTKHRKAPARPSSRSDGTAGKGSRRRTRRRFTWKRLLTALLALLLVPTAGFTVLYVTIDVPEGNRQARAQSNVYVYSDGTVAARTGEINRETVAIERVPKAVRHAFVAAENKSFYEDSGVDPMGLLRGLVNTTRGKGTQGGSTITQQFVKNYYLSQEQTLTRKAKEMVISLKVDRRMSKDDILAGYLNTSYFGRDAYGVQAAARAYYDRNVEDLTVPQAAYLAALLQAPSQYDWAVADPAMKRKITARWNYVLDNMADSGRLDRAERRRMRFPAPVAPRPTPGLSGQAGYFVDAARRELLASGVSEQELAAGGWTITLNIRRDRQKALERAVARNTGHDGDGDGRGPGRRAAGRDLQTGAVSVDPRTGRVVALYGGRNYTDHYLDNATRSDYQSGPAFQPIARAAALERKRTAGRGRAAVEPGSGKKRLRAEDVRDTAVDLGVHKSTRGYGAPRAVELGTIGVSPMELAGAYATFHRNGRKVTPSLVRSATRDGERAEPRDAVGDQVIARETAEAVTAGLTKTSAPSRPPGARDGGPAARAALRATGLPVAAAAGTSDDRKAAWSVGYTPELVTAVGVFGEHHRTRKQTVLPRAAAGVPERIWSDSTGTSTSTSAAPESAR